MTKLQITLLRVCTPRVYATITTLSFHIADIPIRFSFDGCVATFPGFLSVSQYKHAVDTLLQIIHLCAEIAKKKEKKELPVTCIDISYGMYISLIWL